LIFSDLAHGRVILDHYTTDDERTLVIHGTSGHAVAKMAIEVGLVSTLTTLPIWEANSNEPRLP
jgi:hypothetical protein